MMTYRQKRFLAALRDLGEGWHVSTEMADALNWPLIEVHSMGDVLRNHGIEVDDKRDRDFDYYRISQ